MHLDAYRNIDEVGLPRFGEMAKKYSKTIFVTHGPHWWAKISGDTKEEDRGSYPKGPIAPGGKADYLLQKYPNIYADLSADSGLNALTRDPKFARSFLERNCTNILFGTDLIWKRQEIKILQVLQSMDLSEKTYNLILHQNAEKLLKI